MSEKQSLQDITPSLRWENAVILNTDSKTTLQPAQRTVRPWNDGVRKVESFLEGVDVVDHDLSGSLGAQWDGWQQCGQSLGNNHPVDPKWKPT